MEYNSGLGFDEPFLYTRHPIAARYVGSLRDAPETKIAE